MIEPLRTSTSDHFLYHLTCVLTRSSIQTDLYTKHAYTFIFLFVLKKNPEAENFNAHQMFPCDSYA